MIRSILKQVKSNLVKGNNVKLSEVSLRAFSTTGGDNNATGEAAPKDQQQQQQQQPGQNQHQGKNQKQFDNKRNFQNNQQGSNPDKNNDKSKKNFSPFKQQKKREEGEDQSRSTSQPQQNVGFSSGASQRQQRKEVLQFNLKKGDDYDRNKGGRQNREKEFEGAAEQQQQQQQQPQGEGYQSKGFSNQGNEGQFLNQLYKSEQSRNEKQKGANQHQQLMKRIKQYEQNGNPTEQEMKSAIECYNSCGMYEKTISTFQTYKNIFVKGNQGEGVNETILNAVFESYIKSSTSKFQEINEFFHLEFVQPKHLKLIYKDNIQNYISRVSVDNHLGLSQRIESLTNFVNYFTASEEIETLANSFNNIDLSSLSSLFGNANTEQYIAASKVLAALMNLSISHSKGSFHQLNKSSVDLNKVQFEIINTKKIFSNLLELKEYDTCKLIVEALSKGNLLQSSTTSRAVEQQKFIDYKELIKFCIDSQRCTNFWIDVVAKKVDFETFTTQLSNAVLGLRMIPNPPQVFSVEKLHDFFFNISNYGALTPAQVYTLMEISIYLKEYSLAIELYSNHQKYTNRRRDSFVFDKMIQVVNSLNLRYPSGKSTKDHALQAYRKLYTESEQQTGKPINFLSSKIHEIKSHILDQNHDSAYSIFNDRFLKDSIASYQALKIKYFLLLLSQQQEDNSETSHSELAVSKFVNTLAPKQLVQMWNDERNDSYLVKQLANKENEYNDFVKRIEVEKYYSIIKRDINNGFYTIEDRRKSMDVYMNEYERYVIDNFEALDPEYSLDNKLKGAVLDGILKVRKYEELHSKKEERRKQKASEKGDKEAETSTSAVILRYEKDMEDSQIEINKILGRPIDTPVNVPELYKKYDVEDKMNNKYIERYVKNLKFNEDSKEFKSYKMKFMTLDLYKEAATAYPELVEQAQILARPTIPAESNLIFELMTWGAENKQPLAIQLGEIYCDLNGLNVPAKLGEKINDAIDPYNDTIEFLSQLSSAKRLIGDINRERVYENYTHFSQKPQFVENVNKLAEEDKYRDEAAYVLQKEMAVSRLTKYGIPKKYIMEQLNKAW